MGTSATGATVDIGRDDHKIRANRGDSGDDPAPPPAIADGRAVSWEALQPLLAEMAGGMALSEILLDRRLTDAVRERNLPIGEDEIDRERELLRDSLDTDANRATRLLNELRRRQGLGPVRFETLLRRNAMLRALVRNQVELTETTIQQTHELLYGERRQVRIIVNDRLTGIREIEQRLADGASFADLAIEHSTDGSAARGGLLAPVSRADPSYPQTLREAMWRLEIDGTSGPILIDGGYALLRLETIVPARVVDLESARAELERLARLNQERILMEDLARRTLGDVQVTIFDDSLANSWEQRR